MNSLINLSTKNLHNTSNIFKNDDFCFIVGSKEIYCHKFIACFISHFVEQSILADPSSNKFVIPLQNQIFENKSIYEEQICQFLIQIIQGEQIEITNEDMQAMDNQNMIFSGKNCSGKIFSLIYLIESLGNDELKEQVYALFFKSLSVNNQQQNNGNQIIEEIEMKIRDYIRIECFINYIKKLRGINFDFQKEFSIYFQKYIHENYFTDDYVNLIDSIARHFSEINESLIIKLDRIILKEILSSSKLRIESEDSLLRTLINRRSYFLEKHNNESENDFLFQYIQFEFLNENSIQNLLDEISLHDINEDMWEKIKRRMKLPVYNNSTNSRIIEKHSCKELHYDEQNQFNGIFKYLINLTNGNIVSNKIINVSFPHLCCGNPETLVDFDGKGWTHIQAEPSWIQFDFKKRRVQINAYLIKSRHGNGSCFLKNWKVDISVDGKNWETVDKRNNVDVLNGKDKSQLFNVNLTKQFRFIRFTSLKNWWNQSSEFSVGNIELYGNLFENE